MDCPVCRRKAPLFFRRPTAQVVPDRISTPLVQCLRDRANRQCIHTGARQFILLRGLLHPFNESDPSWLRRFVRQFHPAWRNVRNHSGMHSEDDQTSPGFTLPSWKLLLRSALASRQRKYDSVRIGARLVKLRAAIRSRGDSGIIALQPSDRFARPADSCGSPVSG
jgi:hypothetical protein